jgi:hypothetical protein
VSPPAGAAPAPREAYEAVERFESVWIRYDLTPEAWSAALAPLVTVEYKDRLQENAPQRKTREYRGNAVAVQAHGDVITFSAPTDAGTLVVTAKKAGADWLVADAVEG